MAAITGAIAAGVGAATAVAGAVKGARGTPAQTVTSQKTLAPKTAQQQQLEAQSLNNYNQQQGLADQYSGNIDQAQSLRDPAIQQYLNQINGTAFQATPQELAQIQTLRDAMVTQGTQGINQFVKDGLTSATSGAAARGLRGQALGALRGQVVNNATNQVAGVQNQANTFAAQQAIQQPYQRVAAQQNALTTGLTYADQMTQNAIANRQALQSPFLLGQDAAARLAGGTSTSTTPRQGGGVADGILAGAAGLSTGLGQAANTLGSLRDLGALQQRSQPISNIANAYQGGLGQSNGYTLNMPSGYGNGYGY